MLPDQCKEAWLGTRSIARVKNAARKGVNTEQIHKSENYFYREAMLFSVLQ